MTDAPTRTELGWAFLETMLLIRRFEEAVGRLGEQKAFPGHFHLYIGQEATGAGAMAALGEDDLIATTHRNHGHVIARGTDPGAALAEILGRETGINRGRGGTIHLCDPDRGFLQTSGVVGSVVGLAVGGGYACRQLGKGAVTAAFFGDGALEEGLPFETMNIAALWNLPVVLICENNSQDAWGVANDGFPGLVHASEDLRRIPQSLGIESIRVEGIDPFAVHEAVRYAVERCRNGEGPVFIEAMTRRWAGSAPLWPELATGITDLGMATGRTAIPEGQHHDWYAVNDPVLRLVRELAVDAAAIERADGLDRQAGEKIEAAVRFALESRFPAPETATHFTFA